MDVRVCACRRDFSLYMSVFLRARFCDFSVYVFYVVRLVCVCACGVLRCVRLRQYVVEFTWSPAL